MTFPPLTYLLVLVFMSVVSTDWIDEIPLSAWKGHREFATWLVEDAVSTRGLTPTIVDLGVDYGFSTFVFCSALQNLNSDAKVYGVDLFLGDEHAGRRETLAFVSEIIKVQNLSTNVEILRADFSSVAKIWTKPIDILHIDGRHKLEDVKEDFYNWYPHVKEDGIILFHDVGIKEFGVKDFFFTELEALDEGHLLFTYASSGLGMFTKNFDLANRILSNFPQNQASRNPVHIYHQHNGATNRAHFSMIGPDGEQLQWEFGGKNV